jgi:preprotein translocase subunit SecB
MTSEPLNGQPAGEVASEQRKPLPFLPSEVQLKNVFAIEIAAKRFPIEMTNPPAAQLNVDHVNVDEAELAGEVILGLEVSFAEEPRPFEISFKLLGQFTYDSKLTPAQVFAFLEQGSLGVLLPFAREILFGICTRLQIPPIVLPMIKLAPPSAVSVGEARAEVSEDS